MSAIDCIEHAHVGDLNGQLSIYLPISKYKLSEVTDQDKDEKTEISIFTTLFGGGSGEHPAMLILNDAAVLHFLVKGYFSDKIDEGVNKDKGVRNFLAAQDKVLSELYPTDDIYKLWWWSFDKNQWDFNTFYVLHEKFKELGLDRYINSDKVEAKTRFEDILMDMFGAIILEHLPIHVIENEEIKKLAMLFKNNKEKILKHSNNNYMEKLLSLFQIPERYYGRNFQKRGCHFGDGYSIENWKRDNYE